MDFSLETINGVAQGARAVTTAIQGAVETISGIKALLKSPERRSDAEIEAAVNQLALAMENARLGNLLLEAQVTLLQNEVARAQDAKDKLAPYALHRTGCGDLVYAIGEDKAGGQPAHFICPKCYEHSKRSILQGGSTRKTCKECGAEFDFASPPPLIFDRDC